MRNYIESLVKEFLNESPSFDTKHINDLTPTLHGGFSNVTIAREKDYASEKDLEKVNTIYKSQIMKSETIKNNLKTDKEVKNYVDYISDPKQGTALYVFVIGKTGNISGGTPRKKLNPGEITYTDSQNLMIAIKANSGWSDYLLHGRKILDKDEPKPYTESGYKDAYLKLWLLHGQDIINIVSKYQKDNMNKYDDENGLFQKLTTTQYWDEFYNKIKAVSPDKTKSEIAQLYQKYIENQNLLKTKKLTKKAITRQDKEKSLFDKRKEELKEKDLIQKEKDDKAYKIETEINLLKDKYGRKDFLTNPETIKLLNDLDGLGYQYLPNINKIKIKR